MRLTKRRILVRYNDIGLVWKFGETNQVNFHLVATVNLKYLFEGLMTTETYLLFKIAVPFDDYQ